MGKFSMFAAGLLLAGQALLAGAKEAAKPPPPAPAPTVFADQSVRLIVGRGVVRLDAAVEYSILYGRLNELTLALPSRAKTLHVSGEGVGNWAEFEKGRQRRLQIELKDGVTGRYKLEVLVEQPIPKAALGQPVVFDVPAVVPQGVQRETGAIGVVPEPGIRVDPLKIEGATALATADLPAYLMAVREKVRLAYRYLGRPFAIKLQATEVVPESMFVRPEKPLPRLLLDEATGKGTVGERVAKVSVSLSVEAIGEKPQEKVFLPPSVALADVRLGGDKGLAVIRDERGYLLRSTAEGRYSLEVDYVVPVEKDGNRRSLSVPLIAAASSSTTLTVPGTVEVKVTPEVGFEATSDGGQTTVALYGAARGEVKLSLEPKVEVRKARAIVFADQNAQFTVGRGVLRVDTTIDYTILQGKVKEFVVSLPADLTLLSVKGENIRTWDVTTQGAQSLLKVELLDELTGRYQLELQAEQAIGKGGLGKAAPFAIPAIEPQGVERETGAIGILVWKGLKVEPTRTEGVSQVDVREMPAPFQELKDQVHLAYRYLQRPVTIEAQVSEVQAKVWAEVFSLAMVTPEALRVSSRVDYTIRDAGIFQFQIKLGKDVRLLDLEGENINNWERQGDILTIDLRSKAEGAYTLKLETEQPVPAGAAEVVVEGLELAGAARERGHIALEPSPGIKIEPVSATDIMQIDVRDLPKSKSKPAPEPDLAFRYLKHPYELRIAISKVQPEVAATVHTAIKVNEKNVEVTTTVAYDIRKAGIFQLQIALPPGFRLLGCDGKNIDDWKVAGNTLTVALKQKTEGSYTLTLTGKMDVADLAAVPIPVFQAVGAEKETGYVAVRADESLRVKTAKADGLAEIDVKDLPKELQDGKVLLAYRHFAQGWSGTLAAEPIEPHVTAETFTFLSLGEALMQASVTVRYTILYAGVQDFRIQLPDGATNVDITGQEIKHREEDKANHIWTITLQAKRKDSYDLFVTFQQELEREKVDLKFAGLQVLDVRRETGYIAMAARSDLELAVGSECEGLTPIDPQEIPSHYKAGITAPLLLAFRYLRHPYTLHATAIKHEPADVLVAIIEACLLSTTLTEDGNLITDLTCKVRNTREQNLAVALPEGAELWHAFVGGKRVVPVHSEEGGVAWTKVPIAGAGDAARPFVVQLRYGRTIEPLGGAGVLALDFPRMNIPAMRLGWQLGLPEKYRLVSHKGTLRHTDYRDPELANLARIAAPTAQARRPVPAPQRAKGQQAFQNVEAQELLRQRVVSVGKGRYAGHRSIYTGAKPETPNVYYFQSLIAMKQPGNIRSTCLRASVDRLIQGLLVIATAVAVGAFWFLARQLSRWWRLAVLVASILVVFGIRTLWEEAYRQHVTDILWTLIVVTIAVVVWDRANALRLWRARRPEEEPPQEPPAEVSAEE